MDRRNRNTPNRADAHNALEAAQLLAFETEKRRERAQRGMFSAWAAVTAIALVTTVGMVEGCAHDRTVASDVSSSATQQATVASTEAMQPGGTAGTGGAVQPPVASSDEQNSLPPDVVATASDTFVQPGQPVEVTVQATPDVVEMALSDGRGDPLPMVRDSTEDTWRVGYRVPLKPRDSRIGLSVTAKNENHKFARVWLFLTVNDGKQQVESVPDTTSHD